MPRFVNPFEYRARLQPAIAFLEDDWARPFDAQVCARLACMAPFHFQSVFKRAIGCAPLEYVRARRLSEAAVDVLRSEGSTEKIGARFGYGSVEAFARAFRGHFHAWPAEYRANGIDLFRRHSELGYPASFASSSVLECASVQWAAPRVLYGLFLDGLNIHEDNMRLLYRFMNAAKTSMRELDWVIADRCYGDPLKNYGFFVGHEAAAFTKIPQGLSCLEIPARLELVFRFHGSLDDLHGDFRSDAVVHFLKGKGYAVLPFLWKLERRVLAPHWTRRGYLQNIPVAISHS